MLETSEYNHALFDNMAFFTDAVWELNAKHETIFFLHDKVIKEFKESSYSFSDFLEIFKRNTLPEIYEKIGPMINAEYIRNLDSSVSFQEKIQINGSLHLLRYIITPSFEKYGTTHIGYLSLQITLDHSSTKAELEKQKAELNRYLSAISCGIIQYTKNTKKLIFTNDAALKLLGYSSMEEMQNDNFDGVVKTVFEEDAARMKELIKGLKKDGDVVECEYRIMHKDGTEMTCFGNIRLITQGEEEPIIQRSMIDITEHRKTGRLYKEVTDMLQGANMGLWYFVLDEGSPRFIIDPETAALVGCDENISPEKAYNFWYSRITPEAKPLVEECFSKLRKGEVAEVVYPYLHPTRGKIIVRCGGCMKKNYSGSGILIRGYHQDITEYSKRISEQEEKERMERESLQSIASIYSTMHIIDFENKTFEERSCIPQVHAYIEEHLNESLQEIINGSLKSRFVGTYREAALEFADFSTLNDRLGHENNITIELIDIENTWYRLSFIRIGQPSETLHKVIFTSQDIDKTKRKEENLILMSNTDELTKLFNRHAYENDITILEQEPLPKSLWFMGVDLNGLKEANDTKGHQAGDELLVATADCLRRAISTSGKVYRVGGDEFICVFHSTDVEILDTIKYMDKIRESWSGKFSDTFSFSKGIVSVNEIENCTIAKLEKECDRRMYEEKRAYYTTKGDRRHR